MRPTDLNANSRGLPHGMRISLHEVGVLARAEVGQIRRAIAVSGDGDVGVTPAQREDALQFFFATPIRRKQLAV